MDYFFNLVGDSVPNSAGEIHLEPIDIKDVWKEYSEDMINVGECPLRADEFGLLWKKCFPFVKVREYKAVTGMFEKVLLKLLQTYLIAGKCLTCAQLSQARRNFRDRLSRAMITELHSMHRTSYMGERMAYAMRRTEAVTNPRASASFISDGMAQIHCQLPWAST